jgi:hypothetical protein
MEKNVAKYRHICLIAWYNNVNINFCELKGIGILEKARRQDLGCHTKMRQLARALCRMISSS